MSVLAPSGRIFLRALRDGTALGLLPSGPLRDATWTFWTPAKGGTIHGDRNCHMLRARPPRPVEVPLGSADTLGGLAWPTWAHCDIPAEQDQPGKPYLADADRVAALVAAATSVSKAETDACLRAGDYQTGVWRWESLAGATLGLFQPQQRLEQIADPQLRALAEEALETLRRIGERIRSLLVDERHLGRNGTSGRDMLTRWCAMDLVKEQYEGRNPGPLWEVFRDAGWAAVEGALETLPEPRPVEAEPGDIGPNPTTAKVPETKATEPVAAETEPEPAEQADLSFMVPDPMEILSRLDRDARNPLINVFFSTGQQSWPYYRLDALLDDPYSTWQDTYRAWQDPRRYPSLGNTEARRDLLRPSLRSHVIAALAAADTAFQAFAAGMTQGGSATHLVICSDRTLDWWSPTLGSGPWLLPAVTLAFPTVVLGADQTTPAGRRWLLLAVPLIVALRLREALVDVPVYAPVRRERLVEIAEGLASIPDLVADRPKVRDLLRELAPDWRRDRRDARSLREMFAGEDDW